MDDWNNACGAYAGENPDKGSCEEQCSAMVANGVTDNGLGKSGGAMGKGPYY